jgi:hypothetical protein
VTVVGGHEAHGVVVKAEEGGLEPADNEILVVPRVGDDRGTMAVARHVFEEAAALDLESGRVIARAASSRPHVEVRISEWPSTIHGVEVEARRAGVGRILRVRRHAEPGRQVEGHVVIHELTYEGRPGCLRGAVRVVLAERGIDDEGHRAGRQIVLGVEHAPRFADVPQSLLERRAGVRKGRQLREDATESVFADDEAARADLRLSLRGRQKARSAGCCRRDADCPEERSPTIRPE